jgi:hypothetical protein
MENLTTPTAQFSPEKTISKLLQVPFKPVTVLRPLGPYGRMLDLEPSVPRAPDPEFLVRLLTGHASHKAQVRHEAGAQYKNLENLVRGKHKSSPTTKAVLASELGLSIDVLDQLDGSAPEGPLLPDMLSLFRLMEGLPTWVASQILDRHVPCPCCGENLLDDKDHWWSRNVPGIGVAEYEFAERLLNAITGASLIERFLGAFQTTPEVYLGCMACLAKPLKHPIGHWLTEAQCALDRNSLADLTTELQLNKKTTAHFSYGRMKKWSAGHDVMPIEAGEMIAEACGQAKAGKRRLTAARAIALVMDFVAATLPNDEGHKVARAIVHQRLGQLNDNLQIALAAIVKSANPTAERSAAA